MFVYIVYGIMIVGAITLVALTVLRIDWAKHPEKYADAVEEQKKDQEKKAAQQRRKEMEQERQRDWKAAQSALKKGGKHR